MPRLVVKKDDVGENLSSNAFYNTETEHTSSYVWGHVITKSDRSIFNDLAPYSFPDDIKRKADDVYNSMKARVRRGKIRTSLLFWCVYCAHLELKIQVDPYKLGVEFKLTPGQIQKCYSRFSPLQSEYTPPAVSTTAIDYLPTFGESMGIAQESIMEVVALGEKIINSEPRLLQESPRTVAAGILKYYLVMNGFIFEDPNKLATCTGRSNVTIDAMQKQIEIIDNQ